MEVEKEIESKIEITHFINPHLFFFKTKQDDVNYELKDLELNIENFVNKKKESGIEDPVNLKINIAVAVFVSDWNKWVRAYIRYINLDANKKGSIISWAIDYGVLIRSDAYQVIKLPLRYLYKLKIIRISMGGLENCLPAEEEFDMLNATTELNRLPDWTTKAIQTVQKMVSEAVSLEFKEIHHLKIGSRKFSFGRLMVNTTNGTSVNVLKVLIDLGLAQLTSNFKQDVLNLKSIKHSTWKTNDGKPLYAITCVRPLIEVERENGNNVVELNDIGEEDVMLNEMVGELDIGEDIDLERDNAFFDASVSVIGNNINNHQQQNVSEFTAANFSRKQMITLKEETLPMQRFIDLADNTKKSGQYVQEQKPQVKNEPKNFTISQSSFPGSAGTPTVTTESSSSLTKHSNSMFDTFCGYDPQEDLKIQHKFELVKQIKNNLLHGDNDSSPPYANLNRHDSDGCHSLQHAKQPTSRFSHTSSNNDRKFRRQTKSQNQSCTDGDNKTLNSERYRNDNRTGPKQKYQYTNNANR